MHNKMLVNDAEWSIIAPYNGNCPETLFFWQIIINFFFSVRLILSFFLIIHLVVD